MFDNGEEDKDLESQVRKETTTSQVPNDIFTNIDALPEKIKPEELKRQDVLDHEVQPKSTAREITEQAKSGGKDK